MLNVKNAMKSDRLMKVITGMTVGEFLAILPVFSKTLHETAVSKERVRQPGGGAIHTLSDAEAKLFYTLFYLKCYPTFDLQRFFTIDILQNVIKLAYRSFMIFKRDF